MSTTRLAMTRQSMLTDDFGRNSSAWRETVCPRPSILIRSFKLVSGAVPHSDPRHHRQYRRALVGRTYLKT